MVIGYRGGTHKRSWVIVYILSLAHETGFGLGRAKQSVHRYKALCFWRVSALEAEVVNNQFGKIRF